MRLIFNMIPLCSTALSILTSTGVGRTREEGQKLLHKHRHLTGVIYESQCCLSPAMYDEMNLMRIWPFPYDIGIMGVFNNAQGYT